jgi:hypothetical protein
MYCQSSSDLIEPATSPVRSGGSTPHRLSPLHRIQELECLLESVVASWNAGVPTFEKRHGQRVLYTKPMLLTPLLDDTETPAGNSVVVVGHDLSLGGISFVHRQPLPCRKVALRFIQQERVSEAVLVRLIWCRFTRRADYLSGGRLLRVSSEIPIQFKDWDLPESLLQQGPPTEAEREVG